MSCNIDLVFPLSRMQYYFVVNAFPEINEQFEFFERCSKKFFNLVETNYLALALRRNVAKCYYTKHPLWLRILEMDTSNSLLDSSGPQAYYLAFGPWPS